MPLPQSQQHAMELAGQAQHMKSDPSELDFSGEASWPRESRLLSLLQTRGSPSRRRLLLVLFISVPVWLYATTWDIVMMLFGAAADGHASSIGQVVQLVMTRILLLPLLIGAYLLAVTLFARRRLTAWLVLIQAAIASLFSLLTSPTLAVTYFLTNREFAVSHTLQDAFELAGPWQIWLSKTVQYSIVYMLGLVLIFALNAFLRYKSEQLKAEQLRSKWLEAKLGTLRGQLNPHFFFNSLNIIVALINTDPDRAERLLTELSTLLRQSLAESDHEFTTVKEELQFIERYLMVMKARYEDRLSVTLQVESDTLDCPMPTFLLVPLVENAIKHGVARVPGGGTLTLTGQRLERQLRFTIRNCSVTQRNLADASLDTGVGLRNTRQRLLAIYGEHCQFESQRESPGTWLTTVAIPVAPAILAADRDLV
ncbi:MAG TPA: histidine kinase [Gammaproteobacteria bacterium]|nr:histidine kinase [Gammaproteobacteria bacterium]